MITATLAGTTVEATPADGSISPIMWPAMVGALVVFWVLRRAGRDRRERDRFLADVIAEYERVIHEYNLAAQATGRPPYEVNAAVQGGPDDTAWQLAIGNVVKAWDAAAAIGQHLHRAERRGYSSGVGAGWYLGSR